MRGEDTSGCRPLPRSPCQGSDASVKGVNQRCVVAIRGQALYLLRASAAKATLARRDIR